MRWRIAHWIGITLLVLLVGVPVVFALAFLGIQEASEREWLGKAPQHAAIDVRSKKAHPVALLDVGFDSLAARLREFRNPLAKDWLAECDAPVKAGDTPPYQCAPPQKVYGWRDFVRRAR